MLFYFAKTFWNITVLFCLPLRRELVHFLRVVRQPFSAAVWRMSARRGEKFSLAVWYEFRAGPPPTYKKAGPARLTARPGPAWCCIVFDRLRPLDLRSSPFLHSGFEETFLVNELKAAFDEPERGQRVEEHAWQHIVAVGEEHAGQSHAGQDDRDNRWQRVQRRYIAARWLSDYRREHAACGRRSAAAEVRTVKG